MSPVRPPRSSDRARLLAIQAAALDNPWPGLLSAAVDGPPELFVSEDGVSGSQSTGGQPVGYALVVPDHPTAYLAELAVDPRRHGEGIGTRLLGTVLVRLGEQGFETVRLTARADDERLRRFYEQAGFVAVDRLPDHYGDGDAVVLTRTL